MDQKKLRIWTLFTQKKVYSFSEKANFLVSLILHFFIFSELHVLTCQHFSCQNVYFSKKIVHNFRAVSYESCLFSFLHDKRLLNMVQLKSSLQRTANRMESKNSIMTSYFTVMPPLQTFVITSHFFSLILVCGLNSM